MPLLWLLALWQVAALHVIYVAVPLAVMSVVSSVYVYVYICYLNVIFVLTQVVHEVFITSEITFI